MLGRPWTKKKNTNYRIEIEARGYQWLERYNDHEEVRLNKICDDLNSFFGEHKDCAFEAYVTSDEIIVCQFCNEPYEEISSEENNFEPVCANCGKGSKEAMIEKLKESTKNE